MKHFYIEVPNPNALRPVAIQEGQSFPVESTENVDDLDHPCRIYLASVDDDGTPVRDTVAELVGAGVSGLSAIRGPFFKATIIVSGRHSPAIISADHVALARPAKDGPNDTAGETLILLDNGLEYRLAEPYAAIEAELFGVMDVDDAPATP